MLAHSPTDSSPMGTIILSRVDEQGEKEDREHALLLQIGGDSLIAISSVVLETSQQRPVALDLLWKVRLRSPAMSCWPVGCQLHSDNGPMHWELPDHLTLLTSLLDVLSLWVLRSTQPCSVAGT